MIYIVEGDIIKLYKIKSNSKNKTFYLGDLFFIEGKIVLRNKFIPLRELLYFFPFYFSYKTIDFEF